MKNNSKEVFNDVTITVLGNEESRKPAFASFNRDAIYKHVDELAEKMKVKGYRIGEPIQVLKAEYASEHGVAAMADINNNPIPPLEFKDYWLIPDGKHRTLAASLYNDWLIEQDQPTITIPAIEIELKNGESVAEYCGQINILKENWTGNSYINCASHMHTEEPLLQRYSELIKTPSKPNGISLSTLNHIFCITDKLTRSLVMQLCSGKTEMVVKKVTKQIIPAYNIPVGNQFLDVCKKVGFSDVEIGKRYLIKEFNNLRVSDSADFALKVFESIKPEDITYMSNKNGHLIEQNVIDHFQVMIKRVKKNTFALAQPSDN